MNLIFILIIIAFIGLILFLASRLKRVFDYNHYIDSKFMSEMEDKKTEVQEKIKQHSTTQTTKRLNDHFKTFLFFLITAILLTGCCGRLLVIPEPPAIPGIQFQEINKNICLTEDHAKKLDLYMELQKEYRAKLIKALEELK